MERITRPTWQLARRRLAQRWSPDQPSRRLRPGVL